MNLFADLQFEEFSHKYTLDNKPIPSQSNVIKELHNEFPYEQASLNTAISRNVSQEQIKMEWENDKIVGIGKGKDTHLVGEINKRTYTAYDIAVNQYLNKIQYSSKYSIIAKELKAYTREYWIAGTLDLLLYNRETSKFIIADYKTNKSLFKTYNDFLYPPFDNFIHNPYNKYIIQLNGYQIMLEEAGLEIEKRVLIWVGGRGKHSLYTIYELPLITDTLKEYYVTRRNNKQHSITTN